MTIQAGQIWLSRGPNPSNNGLFRVTAPNDSPESPDSWVMQRVTDGKVCYMHQPAIQKREWVFMGLTSAIGSISGASLCNP